MELRTTVTPDGAPSSFFLRVRVKWRDRPAHNLQIVGRPKVSFVPIVPDWVFTAGARFGRIVA